MWKSKETKLNPNTLHFQVEDHGRLLTVEEVATAWAKDHDFRKYYNDILRNTPFKAFFWELPPMVRSAMDRPFEFVVVNSNSLASVRPNGQAFRTYFQTEEPIVVFENLGGDATLVVPTPQGRKSAYSHLAQFVRSGLDDQIDQFWQMVGQTYLSKLSAQPLWLSTSGLGVYWLHVRLDAYPKYYTHSPYRKIDGIFG